MNSPVEEDSFRCANMAPLFWSLHMISVGVLVTALESNCDEASIRLVNGDGIQQEFRLKQLKPFNPACTDCQGSEKMGGGGQGPHLPGYVDVMPLVTASFVGLGDIMADCGTYMGMNPLPRDHGFYVQWGYQLIGATCTCKHLLAGNEIYFSRDIHNHTCNQRS